MRTHLALVLGLGLAFGAVSAYGQETKEQLDKKVDKGVLKLSIEDVKQIEQALVSRGYKIEKMSTDGKLTSDDKAAIEKFQKDLGVTTSKDLNIATLNALGFGGVVAIAPDVKGAELAHSIGATELPAGFPANANVVGFTKNPIGYVVLESSNLKGIEKRLKEEGFYKGEAKGEFTQELVDSLKQFKQAKGIQSKELFDFATLAWFPESGVKVDLTGKHEAEIQAPSWFQKGSMTAPGQTPGHTMPPENR
jgi:peptidoglycan hydrolase-like protein with peptidoglycan-binding domain